MHLPLEQFLAQPGSTGANSCSSGAVLCSSGSIQRRCLNDQVGWLSECKWIYSLSLLSYVRYSTSLTVSLTQVLQFFYVPMDLVCLFSLTLIVILVAIRDLGQGYFYAKRVHVNYKYMYKLRFVRYIS